MNSSREPVQDDPPAPQLTVAGGSSPVLRAQALVLALGAIGDLRRLPTIYRAARASAVGFEELREATLMIHLFAGFPRAIESFRAFYEVYTPSSSPPSESPAKVESPTRSRTETGSELFAKIYGRQTDAVRRALDGFHPVLEQAVIEDAYGRILSRATIDAKSRELMAVCALASIPLPHQLRSHLRGAQRCGASKDELMEMLELSRFVNRPAAISSKPFFDEVLSPDRPA